jgi:Heterokaryon incompatibility protein (HET)
MAFRPRRALWDDFMPDDKRPDDLSQLELVTVTPENKQRLLQKAIDAAEESMESTRGLMARLEQFDPSTAQHFGFKDLTLSKFPFRLLRCSKKATNWLKATNWMKGIVGRSESEMDRSDLTTRSISPSDQSFDSFICLSYCWHSEDWKPVTKGRLDGGWPINRYMLRAFLDQRLSYDEGVWIDAVCIDQNNPAEKMHAIGSMDLLYKSARQTVVVLEDVLLPDAIIDMVERVCRLENKEAVPESCRDSAATLRDCLSRITSSRWFNRAWCWHELEMAAHTTAFLIRTESKVMRLFLPDFTHLCQFVMSVPSMNTIALMETYATIMKLIQKRVYNRGIDFKHYFIASPLAQFHSIITLKSLYESDKISIAVNLAGLQLCYKGPETTHDQCRWILAMLALFAGDLAILCGNGPAVLMSAGVQSTSWLRWSHEVTDFTFSFSGPAFPERAGIISLQHERIILDLLVLKDYTTLVPSTKYISIATSFMERHRENLATVSQRRGREKEMIYVLGCSLECGLPWLLESMTFSKDIAKGMDEYMSAGGMDFEAAVVNDLLIQAYPEHESTISSLTNEQKRSVSQHIVFLMWFRGSKPIHSDSARVGWARAGPLEDDPPTCYCVDWGGGLGKALMFAKYAIAPGYCLAVPVILSDSRWSALDRLWVLETLESPTGSHWTVRGRTRLVTSRPLEEEGGFVLRAAQTVQG